MVSVAFRISVLRRVPFHERIELTALRWRHRDDVAPAVIRVAVPLDQTLLLQLVEDADELAPVEVERVGDLRLRIAGSLAEEEEDRVVVRVAAGCHELGHDPAI